MFKDLVLTNAKTELGGIVRDGVKKLDKNTSKVLASNMFGQCECDTMQHTLPIGELSLFPGVPEPPHPPLPPKKACANSKPKTEKGGRKHLTLTSTTKGIRS